MGQKLPQANLNTNKYTDSQLIARSQQIHAALTANAAGPDDFPDLPIPLATLQTRITAYRTAAAAAIKGTKAQTEAKNLAKSVLVLTLKNNQQYINYIAQGIDAGAPLPELRMKQLILASGYPISFDPRPVAPVKGIPMPIIRKAISEAAGTLKILVRQYTNANRNTLLYQVQYRTSAIPGTVPVPAGPWLTQTFTGQNQILLTGLNSGVYYDWQIGSVGGRDTKRNDNPPMNYTPIATDMII